MSSAGLPRCHRVGLGFGLLHSYGFERMQTRSGLQYSHFPGFQPNLLWAASLKSATQLLTAWVNLGCIVPLGLSRLVAKHETSQAQSSTQPLSLWACAAEITLGASQTLLQSSLQSSCLPLTSVWVFTQPKFSTSPETIRVRVDMAHPLPSPGVAWHFNFSGAGVHSPRGYVPPLSVSHFLSISLSDFQLPGFSPSNGLPSLFW